MANLSNRGWENAAVGSSATDCVDLHGISRADFIRASGHVHRIE